MPLAAMQPSGSGTKPGDFSKERGDGKPTFSTLNQVEENTAN